LEFGLKGFGGFHPAPGNPDPVEPNGKTPYGLNGLGVGNLGEAEGFYTACEKDLAVDELTGKAGLTGGV